MMAPLSLLRADLIAARRAAVARPVVDLKLARELGLLAERVRQIAARRDGRRG